MPLDNMYSRPCTEWQHGRIDRMLDLPGWTAAERAELEQAKALTISQAGAIIVRLTLMWGDFWNPAKDTCTEEDWVKHPGQRTMAYMDSQPDQTYLF